jgi:heme-degrading monooxygenase HmoA
VIARVWTAHATPAQARAYASHVRRHVVPTLRSVDGYLGAKLLARDSGDGVEIVVVTIWRSLAAIQGFAGSNVDDAVVAPEAKTLLSRFDERVRHYQVMLDDHANKEDET